MAHVLMFPLCLGISWVEGGMTLLVFLSQYGSPTAPFSMDWVLCTERLDEQWVDVGLSAFFLLLCLDLRLFRSQRQSDLG